MAGRQTDRDESPGSALLPWSGLRECDGLRGECPTERGPDRGGDDEVERVHALERSTPRGAKEHHEAAYMATPTTIRTSGPHPEKENATSLILERRPVPRVGGHDAEEFPTPFVQLVEGLRELPIGDGRNPRLTKSVEIR